MALDSLSPETQRGVLPHPGAILAAEGTPVRVGFSDEVSADMIRIGIEMDRPQGRQVILTMGQEWAVWQVRMLLEPRLSKATSSKPRSRKPWSNLQSINKPSSSQSSPSNSGWPFSRGDR
jgi:hypothetical protein